MSGGSEKELLHLAARESIERIRLDRVRATGKLRRFLDYLEPHLFDPELNVEHWKRACGVRSNTFEGRFHEAVGFTPFVYLTRARMGTAARLLSWTDLKISRIGLLVGMPDPAAFSRTFRRWGKMRPSQYRQRFQRSQSAIIPFRSEMDDYCRLDRRGMADGASVKELTKLIGRLAEYPDRKEAFGLTTKATTRPGRKPVEPESLQRWRANQIWLTLKSRSAEYQRDLMRSQVGLRTTALFDLLRLKSREEGRQDRGRGVALAELALASLEVVDLEVDLNLRVLGRVWLANARRLAYDFLGSERELALAEVEWGFIGQIRDQRVESELLNTKAALYFYQRRLTEAFRAVDEATAINRRLHRNVELARSLTLRATILQAEGDKYSSIHDLEEALTLLQESEDIYLRATAFSNLAVVFIDIEDYDAALKAADQAQALSYNIGYPLGEFQIAWLRGRVEAAQGNIEKAEALFRNARSGMIGLGEHGYSAVISLDLSILYAEEGRPEDVLELVPSAIAILELCQFRREVVAALDLLRQAIERKAVDVKLLRMIRAMVTELLESSSAFREAAANKRGLSS